MGGTGDPPGRSANPTKNKERATLTGERQFAMGGTGDPPVPGGDSPPGRPAEGAPRTGNAERGTFALAIHLATHYQTRMKPFVYWMLLTGVAGLLTTGCGPGAPSTPLHSAAQEGNYPAVRHHIAARSDLNAKDKSGWTPLHLAAIKGDLPMVKLLAEAGADAAQTGPGDKTPVDVAREKGQTSVVDYLVARLEATAEPAQAGTERRGRGLMDGGLGVSEVLDAQ